MTKVKEIVIVDYEAQWPAAFEAERVKLVAALGEHALAIEHIGSTSVEGLAAKPIIDIMIAVRSLADADAHCIQPIVALGYEYCPQFENMMPYRRYFRRLVPNARIPRGDTHHIHLVEITHPFWQRHLLFRDYVRAHPDVRDAYADLKTGLVARLDDLAQYTDAKTAFIQDIEAKSRAWKAQEES
ncbi:MAG: GrpB family protein [Burkholderiales bacterium]|nr:GrpB family protein [Anaerolineae bacterium]